MNTRSLHRLALVAAAFCILAESAFAQSRRRGGRGGGRFVEMERRALAEPFRGVTTDGKTVQDLFKLGQTGVSTQPVVDAANAFLESLTDAQSIRTLFPVQDDEWRKWANQHSYPRQGMGFNEMTPAQRKLAFGLVGAGLSAKGLKLTQDIMKLNGTLGELTGRH